MRIKNLDPEIMLVAFEVTVGQVLATDLEVRRSEILVGIASRVMRNLIDAPSDAAAGRRTIKGGERFER